MTCHDCGHPRDETTALDDHDRPVHGWGVGSTVCQACEAISVEARRIQKDGDSSAMDGRKFYVTREEDS